MLIVFELLLPGPLSSQSLKVRVCVCVYVYVEMCIAGDILSKQTLALRPFRVSIHCRELFHMHILHEETHM